MEEGMGVDVVENVRVYSQQETLRKEEEEESRHYFQLNRSSVFGSAVLKLVLLLRDKMALTVVEEHHSFQCHSCRQSQSLRFHQCQSTLPREGLH